VTHNAILAVISLLAKKWPCCFSLIESGRGPLKLGMVSAILLGRFSPQVDLANSAGLPLSRHNSQIVTG